MNVCYLCLGGNLGNRMENIHFAQKEINATIGVIKNYSSIYESASWGIPGLPNYLNQVIKVETEHSPQALMSNLLTIEKKLGRERSSNQWSSRTMDIDILFYNYLCLHEPSITIPHPRLHLRNFVLYPLAEIAADYIHPAFNQSITQLKKICPDKNKVEIISSL